MKKAGVLIAFILVLYWTGSLSSCKQENEYDYFLIKIDSVYIPDSVILNETFQIKLFGFIGHNGCHSFNEFVLKRENQVVNIEAWGKVKANPGICSDQMIYLKDEKLKYKLDKPGIYTIKIKQPDGSYLEHQISAISLD